MRWDSNVFLPAGVRRARRGSSWHQGRLQNCDGQPISPRLQRFDGIRKETQHLTESHEERA
jgi:hypothetical protein